MKIPLQETNNQSITLDTWKNGLFSGKFSATYVHPMCVSIQYMGETLYLIKHRHYFYEPTLKIKGTIVKQTSGSDWE